MRAALRTSAFGSTLLGPILLGLAVFAQGAWAQTYDDYDQDVTIGQLGAAQAYDAGVAGIDTGFGPNLWAGTDAEMARALLARVPTRSRSSVTTDMVAKALITGGTPPAGAQQDKAYISARLGTLVKLGEGAAVDQILGRQPQQAGSAQGQQVKADAALMEGNNSAACLIADKITQSRSEPYWAKLRAFCHVTRNEIPAGELTVDLLRRSGHVDANFYIAFDAVTGLANEQFPDTGNDPLLMAMARKAGVKMPALAGDPGEQSLADLIRDAGDIGAEDLAARLSKLTLTREASGEPQFGGFDLDEAIGTDSAASWGQLYGVVANGRDDLARARAASELLRRAEANSVLPAFAALMEPQLSVIPASLKAQGHIPSFAALAVRDSDLSTLRGLYDALPDGAPLKGRIALASDALGNGFMLGQLGQDMSERLADKQTRAIRDVFIASALGASLSADNMRALDEYAADLTGRAATPSEILALRLAAKRGASAETALRAAAILGEGGPQSLRADSLAQLLEALREANLQDIAGRLAAEDFLAGFGY